MRGLLPSLLAAAACLTTAGPAVAQQAARPIVKPGEIFAVFQTVCIAQPGDGAKQVAAAKAAPYDLKVTDASPDGSVQLDNGRIVVGIGKEGSLDLCMVSGRTDQSLSRKAMEDISAPVLDKLGTRKTDPQGNILWLDKPVEPETIYMYSQIDDGPIRVSSWLTGVMQGKK